MEGSMKNARAENSDKEIIYSKAIKAGKRIYYLDVKKNLKDELFLAVTESKKVQSKDGQLVSFEKHKIFLYKEDFDKFMNGMNEVIDYIKRGNAGLLPSQSDDFSSDPEEDIDLKFEF